MNLANQCARPEINPCEGRITNRDGHSLANMTSEQLAPIEFYRKRPGGPAACLICGHRRNKHKDNWACLRAALDAINEVLAATEA